MSPTFQHASEDTLESYSLGTLAEEAAVSFEDHLLICPECQDRLEQTDSYVRAMRHAAAALRRREASGWRGTLSALRQGAALPRLKWAAAGLAVASVLVWLSVAGFDSPAVNRSPLAVTLQTWRGAEHLDAATVPGSRPLLLEADIASLGNRGQLKLRVVDAEGRLLVSPQTRREGSRVSAVIPQGLRSGTYWVRLYDGDRRGDLLREYALRVR